MGGITCWPLYESGSRFCAGAHGGRKSILPGKLCASMLMMISPHPISSYLSWMIRVGPSTAGIPCRVVLCRQRTGQLLHLPPPFFPSVRSISPGGSFFSSMRWCKYQHSCCLHPRKKPPRWRTRGGRGGRMRGRRVGQGRICG